MTIRSGSYPLMNLAADYGVDYGDVLLASEVWRGAAMGMLLSPDRAKAAKEAGLRIAATLGPRDDELHKALCKQAVARWQ